MKTLPFENSKHRLLWKLLLHAIEVILYPGVSVIFAVILIQAIKDKKPYSFSSVAIMILIIAGYYAATFFTEKIRNMPETSDGRRKLKYILCAIIDSVKWLIILLVSFIIFKMFYNQAETIYTFNCLFILCLVTSVCKLIQIWFHALLTRFLEIVDKDAEYGYLLSKAYKYKERYEEK